MDRPRCFVHRIRRQCTPSRQQRDGLSFSVLPFPLYLFLFKRIQSLFAAESASTLGAYYLTFDAAGSSATAGCSRPISLVPLTF